MAVRVRLQDGTYRVIPEEDLHEAIGAVREEQIAIDVTLDEDMNTPPKIYASDAKSSKRGMLIDLNPQFAELDLARSKARSGKRQPEMSRPADFFFPLIMSGESAIPWLFRLMDSTPVGFRWTV